ncbi:hypothetical protein Patl1_03452 [Pistacia atlantica]|uniref:Uncharacterized protein n=1 Tax=Pistacia atlantica TaxID=434234 RepID=A0ACC1CAA3_9ROSI|nr:hypothetical protein Patl1_03452 [Pistacia atlantica]
MKMGENPPATDIHKKNDKPKLDSKLDDVNQITSNDVETNGLGGGVQVMEAAQASAGLLVGVDWWVLDKKPRHVVVFALRRLSSVIATFSAVSSLVPWTCPRSSPV